jgi:hypothetical protein
MEIVEIVSRDPHHANRLFDTNGVEYSHALALDIPELPFKASINDRKFVTAIVLFESDIVFIQARTINIGELVML